MALVCEGVFCANFVPVAYKNRLTGRDILYVAKAAFPFFLLLIVAVAILISFPEIATFLPNKMLGSG